MLFDILGMEPKFVKVPIEVMDGVIKILDTFAGFFANMRDAAEFGKIGRLRGRVHAGARRRDRGVRREQDAELRDGHPRGVLQEGERGGSGGAELGDQAVFK